MKIATGTKVLTIALPLLVSSSWANTTQPETAHITARSTNVATEESTSLASVADKNVERGIASVSVTGTAPTIVSGNEPGVEFSRVSAAYSKLGYSHPGLEAMRLASQLKAGKADAVKELRGILKATSDSDLSKQDFASIQSALLSALSQDTTKIAAAPIDDSTDDAGN